MKRQRQRNLCRTAAHLLQVNRERLYLRKLKSRKSPVRIPMEVRKKVVALCCMRKILLERPEVRFRGKRLMTMSTLQSVSLFHQENSALNMTYPTFLRLHPSFVLPFKIHHFACKCTYCTNIEIVSRSLDAFIGRCLTLSDVKKLKMKILMVYDLQKVVMCEKQAGNMFYVKHCIEMECLSGQVTNGLVVKVLDSQSRGPVFKTAGWLQGRLSLSSSRGR